MKDEKRARSLRQGRALGGYLLACLTSGVVLAIVFVVLIEISSSTPKWRAARLFGDVIGLTMFIAPVVMTMTFLPTVLFVWWSEKQAERRFVVHAGAGMAMAVVGSVLLPFVMKGFTFQGVAGLAVYFLLAGFVAGATYWLISGRHAGVAG